VTAANPKEDTEIEEQQLRDFAEHRDALERQ